MGEADGTEPAGHRSDMVGYGVGLLTWILAAGVFVAGKAIADQLPAWTFCFARVFLATLILLPLVHGHLADIWQFVRRRGLEALFVGGLGLGITQGLMFTALEFTSAINVGIIISTAPVMTLVFAAFVLREALGPWQIVGSLVAFAGIVVITVEGQLELLMALRFGTGDLLTIAAACALAGYTVLLKRAKFELDQLALLVVLMAGGAMAAFPFFAYELASGEHEGLNTNGYLALAYTVSFGGALMYLCYNRSIELLGAGRAGTLIYSQMVFTALLAWLILGETLAWYHYVGCGLIVLGIILASLLQSVSTQAG